MKTLALASLLLIAGSATAQRQTIGIQAGAGFTNARTNNPGGSKASIGNLNLGLSYERFLGKRLTFEADLLFQQRGFRQDIVILDVNAQPTGVARVRFRYNYLALPLKVGYNSGGPSFGFVKLGLLPSMLVTATVNMPSGPTMERKTSDRTEAVERFELGGMIEAGRGFPLADHLQGTVSVSFHHSITPVLDGDRYLVSDLRFYGAYVNLGVQYLLPGRKAPTPAAGQ